MKTKRVILLIILFLCLIACKRENNLNYVSNKVVGLDDKVRYMSYLFNFLEVPFTDATEKIRELDIRSSPTADQLEDEDLQPGKELYWFVVKDKVNTKSVSYFLYKESDYVYACSLGIDGEGVIGTVEDTLWAWSSFFSNYSPFLEKSNNDTTWWRDIFFVFQYDSSYLKFYPAYGYSMYTDMTVFDTLFNGYKFQERLFTKIEAEESFLVSIHASNSDYRGTCHFDVRYTGANYIMSWRLGMRLEKKSHY